MFTPRMFVLIAVAAVVALVAFAPAVVLQIIVRAALLVGGLGIAYALRPRDAGTARQPLPTARVASRA